MATCTHNNINNFNFHCNHCIKTTELAWHFVQMDIHQSVEFAHLANHHVTLAEVRQPSASIVSKIHHKNMYSAILAIKLVQLERLRMILK